jgi:hypothetical protein
LSAANVVGLLDAEGDLNIIEDSRVAVVNRGVIAFVTPQIEGTTLAMPLEQVSQILLGDRELGDR